MSAAPPALTMDDGDAAPTLRPPEHGWNARRPGQLPAIARRFRSELLGIDDDAHIVMSGHQASWWHPGILAKWFAIGACTGQDTRVAWVVVDQDDNDPARVDYPRTGPARGTWQLASGAADNQPVALRHALSIIPPPPQDAATPGVSAGLAAMHARLTQAGSSASSLADQVHRAVASLAGTFEPAPVHSFFATAIVRTDFFSQFLAAMAAHPDMCVGAYNQAVRAVPHAGVRALISTTQASSARHELPLWSITPAGGRQPVFAHELAKLDPSTLAPRALLMTALLRLAGCDLFVHGLGGAAYDMITQEWLRAWLPASTPELAGLSLAPTGIVSATRYIAMPTPVPIASPAQLARATWQAHHARHTPAMLARTDLEAHKHTLLARIGSLPRRSPARFEAYRALHGLLADARAAHASALDAWQDAAQRASASRALAAVVYDRTWAFPMHDAIVMHDLRDAVQRGIRMASHP